MSLDHHILLTFGSACRMQLFQKQKKIKLNQIPRQISYYFQQKKIKSTHILSNYHAICNVLSSKLKIASIYLFQLKNFRDFFFFF
jgi:hypothetical protein